MTEQRSLWDFLEEGASREDQKETAAREQSRRQAARRLQASGHWLILLRVARSIRQPFTLNDISVAVWRAHPEIFGMRGHPFPDNHKVHYILYGKRGLIAKGILQRVRQGVFRVAEGIDPTQLLGAAEVDEGATPTASLDEPGEESIS
jgi:hypothetical protein